MKLDPNENASLPGPIRHSRSGFGDRRHRPDAARPHTRSYGRGHHQGTSGLRRTDAPGKPVSGSDRHPRQTAGIRGRSLIINLPGKPAAIDVCLAAVFPAVPYCLELIGAGRIERSN